MAPVQILANNLLYDISQTAIPTDEVDEEQLQKPKPWDIDKLTRFIVFIGPCSSIFDYATFWLMLDVLGCWNVATPEAAARSASLFQIRWFVESLLTQTLIIHIIRTNKIPFLQSRASWPLAATSAVVAGIGMGLPFSPVGRYLGFTPLPWLYWPLLAAMVLGYGLLTYWVKNQLLRRNWI
jgi:Mg2+-importing ATPase